MRPLEASELADLRTYAGLRAGYRRAVIDHKKRRRMAVGERVTLVFEDRETLRFQVQEMLFVERIVDPLRVQHELDVYNELMPGECEISATLFIEIPDMAAIRSELNRLVGLDEHVSLVIGGDEDAEAVAARFDPKQMDEDRLSAVQYIRFALSQAQARRFEDPTAPAAIRIDHPAYREEVEIPAPVRESLVHGLRTEPEPLLAVDAVPRSADRVWFETPRVRATRRESSPLRVHIVIEPTAAGSDADVEALWRELLDAVRRAALEVAHEHGRARIQAEVGADGAPPRWHVVGVDPE